MSYHPEIFGVLTFSRVVIFFPLSRALAICSRDCLGFFRTGARGLGFAVSTSGLGTACAADVVSIGALGTVAALAGAEDSSGIACDSVERYTIVSGSSFFS
jgi:hypothetical protein